MDITISLTQAEVDTVQATLDAGSLGGVAPTAEQWIKDQVASMVSNSIAQKKQKDMGSIDYSKLTDKQVTDIKAILNT